MSPPSTYLCLLLVAAAALVAPAGFAGAAPPVAELEARVGEARSQAGALTARLEAQQGQLAVAQEQAAAAAGREAELSALLSAGTERAEGLASDVARSRQRLGEERRRLARAREALADRLVLIYMTGEPDSASVVFAADGFDDLVARSDYLQLVEDADSALAGRVEQVRDGVERRLAEIERLEAEVRAYNERLEAARSQISSVRAQADSAAAQLAAAVDSQAATISALQSNIGGWESDIEAAHQAAAERAEAAEAQEAAAASASAQEAADENLSDMLGGPYSIPTAIVMCESGGDYGALNSSSGAGGAYQIIPSTWELYGGEGAPHEASPAEQDAIAAQIWADSGGGAWVCAG